MSEPEKGRITAQPGTAEYREQFERQALSAADAALRVPIVRIGAGLLMLVFVVTAIDGVFDTSLSWARGLLHSKWYILGALELGSVALLGKSMSLRFVLSGVRRKAQRRQ